jgi:hypothetical protein
MNTRSGEVEPGFTPEGLPEPERLQRVLSDEESFAADIRRHVQRGLSDYDKVLASRSSARIFSIRSDQSHVEQHIQHAAMHAFIKETGLSDRFYNQPEYSPFSSVADSTDPTDAEVWCVEITPDDAEVRLNYKYSPGKHGEGWEFCLNAVHRHSRRQMVPKPMQVQIMRAYAAGERTQQRPKAKRSRQRKK